MNAIASTCLPAHRQPSATRCRAAHRHDRLGAPIPAGSSPSFELARFAALESKRLNRLDTAGLFLLAGCAGVAIAACFVRAEQFLAGWGAFENLVRTLLG